jgi:hypothetical protein
MEQGGSHNTASEARPVSPMRGGLKNLFAACHQPMPLKMASLLKSLEKLEHDDSPRLGEWRQ